MQHHKNKHGRILKKKSRIAHGAAQNGFCIKKNKQTKNYLKISVCQIQKNNISLY